MKSKDISIWQKLLVKKSSVFWKTENLLNRKLMKKKVFHSKSSKNDSNDKKNSFIKYFYKNSLYV